MATSSVRRQLSMYVPDVQSRAIEDARKIVDPIQFDLIPAHVTLCRETELTDWEAIERRIVALDGPSLALTFGPPMRFYEHGIWMKCIDGMRKFRELREYILGGREIDEHAPHMTLAHPTNQRAPGNSIDATRDIPSPLTVSFDSICLIEQTNNQKWKIISRFAFNPGIG